LLGLGPGRPYDEAKKGKGMKTLARITRIISLVMAVVLAAVAAQGQTAPKKILFFSKSSGFEHDMIKKRGDAPSPAEKILSELGQKNNLEFSFSKDGSLFTPAYLARFDAFFFYTTGDLTKVGTDKNPPMTAEGKAAFLEAIHNGKGFIGTHSATDTFHTPGGSWEANGDNADPYIKMIGGEFIIHGSQQATRQICVDKSFPGMSAVPDDFGPLEEWYSLKDFAPNLHVLLVQDTSTMNKSDGNAKAYDRPNYPSTWAHLYGKGRVFYTSMGHREDVWTSPVFQKVLLGGINWAVGNVEADVTPNLETAAPQANVLPKP
jgi:type 1 glutamine amidotransferase